MFALYVSLWLKCFYKLWKYELPVRVKNFIDSHFCSIIMSPYSRWVQQSFKNILVNACDEYVESTDHGNDKTHSKVIACILKDITNIAEQNSEKLPDDLEKVFFIFSTLHTL
jgi:hypothetical protein